MNAATAYARLHALGVPVLRTAETAAVLGISGTNASQVVRRLAASGLVRPLSHGLVWVGPGPADPWVALEYVAAPYPAYASLHSGLYLRGALSQLPEVFYAVTLGRRRLVRTSLGRFSLHRVAPELFGGFETLSSGAKLATLEKALFDLAYLGATRTRLFGRPPELELPRRLDRAELSRWLARVGAQRRRADVRSRLDGLLRRAGRPPLR